MANPAKRRPENISGSFFVDSTCIDCDTCRWMAPESFTAIGDQSAVYKQPESPEQKIKALQALISCPTASIGSSEKDLGDVQNSFPILIDDNVYHCGYHSAKSYGAASYLIKRPEGNILVDSPRFSKPLIKRLEELGGVRYMFLTHKDDVAEHQKFHEHFGCERIIHKADLCSAIPDAEIIVEGDTLIANDPNLVLIHIPGHKAGHMALLYKNKFLFSGDHLAYSLADKSLVSWREYSDSWGEQIKSVTKLLDYSWEWLLPGHAARLHLSPKAMRNALQELITKLN